MVINRNDLLGGAAALICAIASAPAVAQETRTYDIPAGSMHSALDRFAAQANVQMLYAGEAVEGLTSGGLRGRYTLAQGLDRLLAGSGLNWSQTRPGVVVVRANGQRADVEAGATDLGEVVVTGTLLKSSGELASPVVMIDRRDLDRRALGTVAEVLLDLPQNYAGSGSPAALLAGADRAGSNGVVASGVNLRGLGPDATLVLVNGRRIGGAGFRGEFADVSALPSAAVERVDVLLDGASALYGSDAVAGVVNVIMRPSFDGHESRFFVSVPRGGGENLVASHLAGTSWSSGSALLSYELQFQNTLGSGDRDFTADGDLRPFGGSDRRSIFSSPANLVAFDAAAGAYVSEWAIVPGPDGTARGPGDFAFGRANLLASTVGVDLVPEIERHSVYGRVRQTLSDAVEISGDLRFSRRDYSFANAPSTAVFDVTTANPFFVSPSGETSHTVAYSFYGDLGNTRQNGQSRSLGLSLGADVALGDSWSLEGYVTWAEERGESRIDDRVNTLFLDEALGNAVDGTTAFDAAEDGYFNPFGAGQANGRAVLDFVAQGFSSARDRGRSGSANLLVEGALVNLPGGELRVAFGGQVRRETFRTETTSFISTPSPLRSVIDPRTRTIAATFAELRAPLIGPDNPLMGVQRLELSVAGRVERYDDFGMTANPKVGVIWSPTTSVVVRGSWGTSFRAPALPQIYDASEVGATLVPQPNGARVLALYLYGGNQNLAPEKAETSTIGFDYEPPSGLGISVNLFDTRFADRIGQPASENLAGALTDPTLAPFVQRVDAANNADDFALVQSYITQPGFVFGTRFPPSTYGAIIDGRWVNAAETRVRGLDASAQYAFAAWGGEVNLDASASYLFDFVTHATPASDRNDVLDRVGYPTRLRARAGGSWTAGPWTTDLHLNHVSSYRGEGDQRIDAWNTVDLRAAYDLSAVGGPDLRLAAAVSNVFDEEPPFYDAPTGYGFDAGQANLLGRVLSLQLIRNW